MSAPRYDRSLFQGTAHYYAAFRPGIPAEVSNFIAREARADGHGRLLDVGVGTGQVLLALAPRFELSVGIEPDGAMLDEARREISAAGLADRVILQEGRAPDLPREHAPFRLVTFGRVFHWLDRPATARAVLEVLEPQGYIAVLGDGSFWTGQEDWQGVVREVVQRYLGAERRAGGKTYAAPGDPFDETLRQAGFENVREYCMVDERTWTIDTIVGYLYSTSFASRDLFGDDVTRFEHDLAEALGRHGDGERFVERASFGVWIGDKPGDGEQA
jgi:SAM-dependent methyltransferase